MTTEQTHARLKELIGEYWEIAYAEGKEGLDHDTEDQSTQLTWRAISKEIEALAASAPPADPDIEQCPELNLNNYDADDVAVLNDWAVRAAALLAHLRRGVAPSVQELPRGELTEEQWRDYAAGVQEDRNA